MSPVGTVLVSGSFVCVKCRSGTFQVRVKCVAAVGAAESSTTELERAHARRRAASIMMRSRLGPIPVQCGHFGVWPIGIGVVQAATVAAAPSESTGTAWGIHGGIGLPSQPLAHWQRHERPLETPAPARSGIMMGPQW